jgi:hypothetical protein
MNLAVDIIIGGIAFGTAGLAWIYRPQPHKAAGEQLEKLVLDEMREWDLQPAQAEAIDIWTWANKVGWARVAANIDMYPLFKGRLSQ